MAKDHWKKFLPNYCRKLEQEGTLEEKLKEAGEKAKNMSNGSYGEKTSKERSPGDSTPPVYNSATGRKTGLILYHGTKVEISLRNLI